MIFLNGKPACWSGGNDTTGLIERYGDNFDRDGDSWNDDYHTWDSNYWRLRNGSMNGAWLHSCLKMNGREVRGAFFNGSACYAHVKILFDLYKGQHTSWEYGAHMTVVYDVTINGFAKASFLTDFQGAHMNMAGYASGWNDHYIDRAGEVFRKFTGSANHANGVGWHVEDNGSNFFDTGARGWRYNRPKEFPEWYEYRSKFTDDYYYPDQLFTRWR